MQKTVTLPLVVMIALLLGCETDPAPHDPAPVEPTKCGNVRNMHRIGDLYVAGGVTPDDYPLLKEMGIKTVFNIRYDKETPELDGQQLATAQGLTYVHLPWNGPDELTDEKLDAMREVLSRAERPILFHCGSANRVGAGWLAYRVLDEGVELETALAEAKTFGLRTPAYETITVEYISRSR